MANKKVKKYDFIITDEIADTGKIMLGMPRERVTFNKFLDNRDAILAWLNETKRGNQYYQAESHRVDHNRDDIVSYFLEHKSKPDWLWMIDTDMEHPLDAAQRMAKYKVPIIGALYFHRGDRHDPLVFNHVGKEKDKYGRMSNMWRPMRDEVYNFLSEHSVPFRDGPVVIDKCLSNPLWEVDAIGTGCILIHRSVFETMPAPWFEYHAGGNSEDLTFCHEAKFKYGIPIHADVSTICGHYNWVAMGQAQFRTLYLARGINKTNFTENQAISWLQELYGLSRDEAQSKLKAGNAHMVGDYWNSRFKDKEPTEEEVKTFYEEDYVGDLYVIELLHWNSSHVFQQIRQQVMNVRNKKVIELGGGLGSTAIQLAIQMCDVLTVEPNKVLQRFLDMRWKTHQKYMATEMGELHVMDNSWMEQVKDDYFDVGVAFDTFEHIPLEQLREVLKNLNRTLVMGAPLYFHNNFKQQDLYPMHFDYSEIWPNLLLEAGFAQQSEALAIKVK